MPLFTSILPDPDAGAPRDERRRAQRFAIPPGFPLKAVLSYIGRDEAASPATGLYPVHQAEERAILEQALER